MKSYCFNCGLELNKDNFKKEYEFILGDNEKYVCDDCIGRC